MCATSRTHRATSATHAGRPPVTDADPSSVSVSAPVHRTDAPTGAMRTSDAEREAAAEELRFHAATGRLDVEELDARLGAVLSARTRADVDAVFGDLPTISRTDRSVPTPSRAQAPELHAYAAVMLLLLAIWLFTGAGHFWPLYPALGWGLPLLLRRDHAIRRA